MDVTEQTRIKQKAGQGVFILVLRYGLCFLLNFGGSVLLVRILGAKVWGQYALSFFVFTSFIFVTQGLWGYIIQRPEPPQKQLGMCFLIQQALSLVWGIVVLVGLNPLIVRRFGGEGVGLMVAGAVLGGYFYSWRWLLSAWQERKMDYVGVGASEVLDALVFNLTAVAFALAGWGVWGIAIGNAARGLVSAIYMLFRSRLRIEFVWKWQYLREIFSFGLPFMMYTSLQWLPTQALPVMVGFFLGPAALGYVNIAYKFMEYPRVLVALVTRVSFNYFSRLASDTELFRQEAFKSFEVLFFLLGLAITVLAGSGLVWLPVIYGKDFRLSAVIMALVSIPFFVNGCLTFFAASHSARGRVKEVALVQVGYNAVFWASALVLIPRLKDWGLPAGEWIALPFGLLLVYFVSRDIGRIWPLSKLTHLLLSAIAILGSSFLFYRELYAWGFLTFFAGIAASVLVQFKTARTVMGYAGQLSIWFKWRVPEQPPTMRQP